MNKEISLKFNRKKLKASNKAGTNPMLQLYHMLLYNRKVLDFYRILKELLARKEDLAGLINQDSFFSIFQSFFISICKLLS